MDMRVKDFDDFRRPSRKPWLLLLVLLAAGGMLARQMACRRSDHPQGEDPVAPVVTHLTPAESRDGRGTTSLTPVEARSDAAKQTPGRPIAKKDGASVLALFQSAREREDADDFIEARRIYLRALDQAEDPDLVRDIENRLGRVSFSLIATPRPMPEKEDYIVRRGDAIERIARAFGTTVELVEIGNGIRNRHLIREGDRLRVFSGKFALTVSKRRREMIVLMNGEFFKRYAVGIGKHDQTPEGTFIIAEKQKEPVWWPQGREIPFGHPENILGTRWMSLRATGSTADVRGYGIHGTWEPESIGKAESAGCLRMVNSDVEELYIYLPVGVPVTILP